MRHGSIVVGVCEVEFVTSVVVEIVAERLSARLAGISLVRASSHGLVCFLHFNFFAQVLELALEILILDAQVFHDIVLESHEWRESK